MGVAVGARLLNLPASAGHASLTARLDRSNYWLTDVEQFLLTQTREGRAPRTRNIYLASIRWLLRAAGRRDVTALLRQARVSKALGTVLSGSDVERLLVAITSLKYRAVLMTAYGAGLRIGEVLALEVTGIDSKRMLIRVKDGKTGGRFYVMGGRLLAVLREYWKQYRPRGRCFSLAATPIARSHALPFARCSSRPHRDGARDGSDHQSSCPATGLTPTLPPSV